MIRHIVMWKVRGDTREAKAGNVERLRSSFHSLRGRVPGLLHLEIGADISSVDYACDVVLFSEFASQAALDAYAEHPEHLRVKREVADLRTERHQVDYLVLPSQGDERWLLSRPPEPPFDGKPVAMMGASPGPVGTARVQYHLRQVLVFMNTFAVNKPEVFISHAASKFNEAGELADETTAKFIGELLASLQELKARFSAAQAPGLALRQSRP